MIETSDMQFEERMVTPREVEEDHEVEVSLRPQTLVEYIGQDKVKENLAVYIEAAKRRGDPLDHVLLYGPPGLGKTTLSSIIATKWALICVLQQDRQLKRQGIWQRY